MSKIDFGLMLKMYDDKMRAQEVLDYNVACIERLAWGFTTLWFEDHLQWSETGVLESLTTLSYFAAHYPTFRVGTLVLDQSYRNPALLAKMMANLQLLSKGRCILGIGAGWKEDEYHAYGYAYPDTKTRMEQLEEVVTILRAMWMSSPATFQGKYHSIQDAYCEPPPIPLIPLLIGGGGEQRTLRIVAKYADWWNFNSCPVEEYAHKVEALRRHCEEIGRDMAEIKLTYLATVSASEDPEKVIRHPQKHYVAGNADEVTREIEQFVQLGVTHFMFRMPDLQTLEHFVEAVVPRFREG